MTMVGVVGGGVGQNKTTAKNGGQGPFLPSMTQLFVIAKWETLWLKNRPAREDPIAKVSVECSSTAVCFENST
jgi:hypothetical protein